MSWQDKLIEYCRKYNIPLNFLADTLVEPKVVPMVRGKAFEFSVYEKMNSILDSEIWDVQKPSLNAQLGFHDIDVLVIHRETGRHISVECKLAKKGSCKVNGDITVINVKCMRSRTLGEEMIRQLAPRFGVTQKVLKVHNDQYLESDFDFVVTSIGNAFFITDEEGSFIFAPNENQRIFLQNFPGENLNDEVFNSLFIACTKDISIKSENNVVCTRRKCENKENCGFVPNYPRIEFRTDSLEPINNWHKLEEVNEIFL